MDVDFKALYQSSLKLTTAAGDAGIPRLNRGLEQLDNSSRENGSRKNQAAQMDKAKFLLATKGIDADKLSKDLQSFEMTPEAGSEEPLEPTDVDGYLSHHQETIQLTALEDVSRRTMQATHDRTNQAMIDDFEIAKKKFLERLGGSAAGVQSYPRVLSNEGPRRIFGSNQESETKSIGLTGYTSHQPSSSSRDTPMRLSHLHQNVPSSLTEEMGKYLKVVERLNESRVPNGRSRFDLIGELQQVAQEYASPSTANSKWEHVLKCWQLLSSMLNCASKNSPLSERHFTGLNESLESDETHQSRLLFAQGAQSFLEDQYKSLIQRTVQRHELATGGSPGLIPIVRAFVKYIQSSRYAADGRRDDADLELNAWALVYFSLRSGGRKEAVELAQQAGEAGDDTFDTDVLAALKHLARDDRQDASKAFLVQYPDEHARLSKRYEDLVAKSDASNVVNVYERSVLNLLTLSNANASEQKVATTIEDYLWQRLCFIQPSSDYNIFRLARSVQKFGPDYFEEPSTSATNFSSFLYFEILLLTQDFEKAVTYAASKGFMIEAAHFALALNHYGLIRSSILQASHDDAQLDYVRLIRQYIHSFQRANAREAAEYVVTVSDTSARSEMLAELLLDTRQFELLAGSTSNTDGLRSRGALDRLLRNEPEDEIKELVLNAARKAEARGRPHDALSLLKTAGDIEGAITLLNVQLSSTLSAPPVERQEWFRLAQEFAEQWMRFPWVQRLANMYARSSAVALQTLLNMNVFLELFEKQQYADVIRFVDELQLLPTPQHTNLSICVDRFLAFDETVRQNFHVLLLGYVESLVREAERVKAELSGEDKRKSVAQLREKSELVVTFAGMVKFRLPTGTNERLNRMETMIY